jgi:hypothetical protein
VPWVGMVVAMFRLLTRQCTISLATAMVFSSPYIPAALRIMMPLLWEPVLVSFVALCKQGMRLVVGSADLVLESISKC